MLARDPGRGILRGCAPRTDLHSPAIRPTEHLALPPPHLPFHCIPPRCGLDSTDAHIWPGCPQPGYPLSRLFLAWARLFRTHSLGCGMRICEHRDSLRYGSSPRCYFQGSCQRCALCTKGLLVAAHVRLDVNPPVPALPHHRIPCGPTVGSWSVHGGGEPRPASLCVRSCLLLFFHYGRCA